MAERIKLADTAKAEVDSILQKLNIKQSALCQIVAPGRNGALAKQNNGSTNMHDGLVPQRW